MPNEPATTKSKKKAKKPTSDLSAIVLPDWLPATTWGEFVEHRRLMRRPLTMLSATKTIAMLERYLDAGHDPAAIVDTTIANGWQGVFEPRGGVASIASKSKTVQALENLASFASDARRYEGAAGRVRRKIRENREARELAAGRDLDGDFAVV